MCVEGLAVAARAHDLPSSAHLQRVLDTITGGLLVTGPDGTVTYCNAEFSRYFGLPDGGSWIGAGEDDAIERIALLTNDPPAFRSRAAELVGGMSFVYEHVTTADGRIFERDYLPMTGPGDSYDGHVWHYWDVTEQRGQVVDRERRLQAEIRAQQLGVHAQRIRAAEAERTGLDLAERNRALLAADLQRKELLATASHELRTPLTTIINFSEIIGDDADEGSELAQFSAAINRNAGRLLDLVDDLLLLARIGSGESLRGREDVDLSALVVDAVEDARAVGDPDGVTIEPSVQAGLRVSGWPDALARAVANVLGNAVKYSHHAGTISVALRRAARGAELTVRDRGIGIPADELSAVFGQFYRASTARSSGRPGTGLGLSIVRGILDQHDGSVAIDSTEGEGTTVTLSLPTVP